MMYIELGHDFVSEETVLFITDGNVVTRDKFN